MGIVIPLMLLAGNAVHTFSFSHLPTVSWHAFIMNSPQTGGLNMMRRDGFELNNPQDSTLTTKQPKPGLGRREAWGKAMHLLLPLTVFVSGIENARGAIPTMDDYEKTNTGAKVKPSSALSASQQEIIRSLSQKSEFTGKLSLMTYVDAVVSSLTALEKLVSSADWAGVRSVLRGEGQFEGNVLSMVRKPYFGVKGAKKSFSKLFDPNVNVESLEESREEFSFALAELEDFALENRSIFFNSLDRKQVDELIAETGYQEKVSEGKALLNAAKSQALELRKVASKL